MSALYRLLAIEYIDFVFLIELNRLKWPLLSIESLQPLCYSLKIFVLSPLRPFTIDMVVVVILWLSLLVFVHFIGMSSFLFLSTSTTFWVQAITVCISFGNTFPALFEGLCDQVLNKGIDIRWVIILGFAETLLTSRRFHILEYTVVRRVMSLEWSTYYLLDMAEPVGSARILLTIIGEFWAIRSLPLFRGFLASFRRLIALGFVLRPIFWLIFTRFLVLGIFGSGIWYF